MLNFRRSLLGSVILTGILVACNNDKAVVEGISQEIVNVDSIYTPKEEVKKPLDSNKYYVYLTFDDGPYNGSKAINEIARKEEAHITAFVVGSHATTNATKKIVADYQENPYVEVANHSFSHANNRYAKYYTNPKGVFDDIIKNEQLFNLETKSVRLPGRNLWYSKDYKKGEVKGDANKAGKLLADAGYHLYGWDIEWHRDKKSGIASANTIYNAIIEMLDKKRTLKKNHIVLLAHDDMFNKESEAHKLLELIQKLKNNEKVELVPISEYPFDIEKPLTH